MFRELACVHYHCGADVANVLMENELLGADSSVFLKYVSGMMSHAVVSCVDSCERKRCRSLHPRDVNCVVPEVLTLETVLRRKVMELIDALRTHHVNMLEVVPTFIVKVLEDQWACKIGRAHV